MTRAVGPLGRGSRTPVAQSRSSSSQPVAAGCAAGGPGWALTRHGQNIGGDSKHNDSDVRVNRIVSGQIEIQSGIDSG